jgi:diadenosine tetraphosphate (Ap4A) HIT family hydrolase
MSEQRQSPSAKAHPVPRVQAALEGKEPGCVAVFDNSVLLLGEHQFYPGYCVLWARNPVKELHQLSPLEYMNFMIELRQCCEAVERAYAPWKLNLASLGNQVQHLHVHLFPRSADDARRLEHPWAHAADFEPAGAGEAAAAVARLCQALQGAQA